MEGAVRRRSRRVLGHVRRRSPAQVRVHRAHRAHSASGRRSPAISVAIAALLLGMFYVHSRDARHRGRSLLAIVVYAVATDAVWIIYDYSQQYLTFDQLLVGSC